MSAGDWFQNAKAFIDLDVRVSRLGKLDEVKAECVEKCAASTVTRTQSCHCTFLKSSEICVSYISYQYFFSTCDIMSDCMSVGGVEDAKWKIKSRWNVKYMTAWDVDGWRTHQMMMETGLTYYPTIQWLKAFTCLHWGTPTRIIKLWIIKFI